MRGRRSMGSSTATVAELPETPSPKSRKTRHCRTCGSPMLGHKKALCAPADETTGSPPIAVEATDLALSLEKLDLATSDEEFKLQRRRSSIVKKQPSLESLSTTSSDILSAITTPVKQESEEPTKGNHPSPSGSSPVAASPRQAVPSPSTVTMPGTLIKHDDSDDDSALLHPIEPPALPLQAQAEPVKKRKSVRVSLPGPDSNIRMDRAKHLDASKFETELVSMFIKTTLQHSGLFTVPTKDCEPLERAALALGLQCHYVKRSDPAAVKSGSEADANFIIVAKNDKAIDDTLHAMHKETKKAAPPGTPVTSFYLTQLTAAGLVAGAAAMWAGLAFS